MACRCPKRLRKAAIEAGWVLEPEGWWWHPTNGELPFHNSQVAQHHTKIALTRPSLRWESVKVIAKEGLDQFSDTIARLGLGPHITEEPITMEESHE